MQFAAGHSNAAAGDDKAKAAASAKIVKAALIKLSPSVC
jgi:hypothetical protein